MKGDVLTVGSLFAGIGGIDLGLEMTGGFRTAWQVEIDPFCRKVLAKHWPDVPRHDDVRTFPPDDSEAWRVDLIAGGFPCQDISYAGRGVGLAGERSGLWFEFARVVGHLRPRYVFVENVSALLARGLDTDLGTLAALGYVGESHCLPAAYVGAPHIRDRVFILAYSERGGRREGGECRGVGGVDDDGTDDVRPLEESGGRRPYCVADSDRRSGDSGPERPGRETGPDAGVRRCGRRMDVQAWRLSPEILARFRESAGVQQWGCDPADDPESQVGRMAHGVPRRVDRLRGLGNAVVPQVARFWGERILEHHRANGGGS